MPIIPRRKWVTISTRITEKSQNPTNPLSSCDKEYVASFLVRKITQGACFGTDTHTQTHKTSTVTLDHTRWG